MSHKVDISQPVYRGESACQIIFQKGELAGKQCSKKASYLDKGKARCSKHSNRSTRKELPEDPVKVKEKDAQYEIHWKTVEEARLMNLERGSEGEISVTKLKYDEEVAWVVGWINVYPNYTQDNIKYGVGCASLSPKSLGPVTGIPHLPDSLNLENFHQFAKFWLFELLHGWPTKEAEEFRRKGHLNPVPLRHKHPIHVLKKKNQDAKNWKLPECTIYYDQTGKYRKYGYIECRFFYCYFYTLLVLELPQYKKLQAMKQDGYNLNILGFDGYSPQGTLMEMYLDPSEPFGHEMVLYSLLMEDDPEQYPWMIYYRKHPELYAGVIDL